MKAKLIHRGNGDYKLYVNESTYAQSAPNPHRKLSKQNCDEIFGVVDVEKLAMDWRESTGYHDADSYSYILGFNKAMELNKDKLFTLEDMYDAVMLGVCFEDSGIQGISTYEELKELAIKRALKPTEIEVEIEHYEIKQTKTYNAIKGVKGSGHKITTTGYRLKLDSEGCLILKKINH
jgi:hypothetical protein